MCSEQRWRHFGQWNINEYRNHTVLYLTDSIFLFLQHIHTFGVHFNNVLMSLIKLKGMHKIPEKKIVDFRKVQPLYLEIEQNC